MASLRERGHAYSLPDFNTNKHTLFLFGLYTRILTTVCRYSLVFVGLVSTIV